MKLYKEYGKNKAGNGNDITRGIYSLSGITPRGNNNNSTVNLSASATDKLKGDLIEGIYLNQQQQEQIRAGMQESSWLYRNITHMGVKEHIGTSYSLGERKLYSGRTLTNRFRQKLAMNGSPFELHETDSYINMPWRDFINIANLSSPENFEATLKNFFQEAMALDALRIGFNGKFYSPETNPEEYPMGEDVNVGWHEVAKNYSDGKQVLTENISLGAGGDFENVDQLANHLIETRIPETMRNHPGLTVMVGADLAQKERLRLFDGADRAADSVAAQSGLERVAGRFAMTPPFMPGNRLVVTLLSNLHIYTQEETAFYREGYSDTHREYFWSLLRMEGYGLEDCNMYAAVDEEAITLL